VTEEGRSVQVMIVDDVPELRDFLRAALEVHGIDVVAEAGDGREAVTLANQHQPDVVLLDLAMPEMSGQDALPEILAGTDRTQVVIFSAFAEGPLAERLVQEGAYGYLEKGTPMATVAELVLRAAADPR
jgi:DNA-binding NarL/FixJ family response regulator